jgi:predicted lipid carrier protein YhbT
MADPASAAPAASASAASGTGLAALDFAQVSPQEFAGIVKGMSGRRLAEAMQGELRLRILREVFARMQRQFRPDGAGSLKTLIRWRVGDGGDGPAVFEASIADGACTVAEGGTERAARVTLSMSDAEFLKLVSGNGNPVTMFMLRRLKVDGDVGMAAGLTRLFDIPKA